MKICFITGSRAEYGLLYWVMKSIQTSPDFQLQLIVTNMHLSHKFGYTINEIIKDGFKVDSRIPLSDEDNELALSESLGILMKEYGRSYQQLKPDAIAILGDRYEVMAAAFCAQLFRIPVIHFHGGELTKGSFDNAFRHAITKLSHLHFTSTLAYRKRVIQMGEKPETVFHVGALGLEYLYKTHLLDKNELEKELNIKFRKKNFLVTFHPVTYEKDSYKQFEILLDVLENMQDSLIIFTLPNSDPGNSRIIENIRSFCKKHHDRAVSFISLGNLRYLSLLKEVDAVIGNSSSGIIEAPSLKTATINIGSRQKGRIKAESVIDCKAEKEDIQNAIDKVYSEEFQKVLQNVVNPYDAGIPSDKILSVIRNFDFTTCLEKDFYDISF